MEIKSVIKIIGMDCPPDLEQKFNKWYDEVHIPMLLKIPGLVNVTRCRIGDRSRIRPAGLSSKFGTQISIEEYPEYLTIYEFEDEDAFKAWEDNPGHAEGIDETNETWKDRAFHVKWGELKPLCYRVMKTWTR